MQVFSRRRLLTLGALTFLLQACSSPPKQRQIELQGPGETLVQSRTGRFSVQVMETPPQENPRGSQGRFEWLEYQSAQQTRRLLLIIGPFGQSLGGIEQVTLGLRKEFTLNFFDEQGLLLEKHEQWRLLSSLAGRPIKEDAMHRQAMQTFTRFLADAITSERRVHDIEMPLADIALRFRIALDAKELQ